MKFWKKQKNKKNKIWVNCTVQSLEVEWLLSKLWKNSWMVLKWVKIRDFFEIQYWTRNFWLSIGLKKPRQTKNFFDKTKWIFWFYFPKHCLIIPKFELQSCTTYPLYFPCKSQIRDFIMMKGHNLNLQNTLPNQVNNFHLSQFTNVFLENVITYPT